MALTSQQIGTLRKVNLAVNRAIAPRSDGTRDVWTVNAASGDCEDYTMTKRLRLVKAGFPPGALRIAHVKTRKGESHAVLIVRSQRGDLVLDNLTDAIRPLKESGLRLVAMTGSDGHQWI